jgi:Alw26I/Eco31I/Esp3I family type II restriction endonuclease
MVEKILNTIAETDVPGHRYGDARRSWHPLFVAYMDSIVEHQNYSGMPCTRDFTGKIDWTIPSNRPRGSKNWDGNERRREWWRNKAVELCIPVEGHWLSEVAKRIHPFGRKPCQTCGRIMEIAYVYPNKTTIAIIEKVVPEDFLLPRLGNETVFDLLENLKTEFGTPTAVSILSKAFPLIITSTSIEEAGKILLSEYVVKESRRLSPGVMSNAPDRLDGFHTYNLCCRSREDTGRSQKNLVTYGVDRRAFEQWSEGDWAIADSVMAQAGVGPCSFCSKVGQISADHIGPISLGFAHTTNFRPLCIRCNSAKNNRMSLQDIFDLRMLEEKGIAVASWQILPLWNSVKTKISSDEDAAKLSKLLRILQHHYLISLFQAVNAGVPDLLIPLLQIHHSYNRIELRGFNAATLTFDSVNVEKRQDKYALSRGSRVMRIAFDALKNYSVKTSRNIQLVSDEKIGEHLSSYSETLSKALKTPSAIREKLALAISLDASAKVRDALFTEIVENINASDDFQSDEIDPLKNLISAYAGVLSERWERGVTVAWDDFGPDS